MRKRRKWLAALMTIAMFVTMIPAGAFAQGGETGETTWDVSKSKTATNLVLQDDGTYRSDVTLSLPSAQSTLDTDIVFVLDKSTSTDAKDEALAMLQEIRQQVADKDATVKVGVVTFNRYAHRFPEQGMYDLSKDYDAIKSAINTKQSGGTNSHAGLIAANKMLEADQSVSSDRKYLIFVSDGITYLYGETYGEVKPTSIALKNGDNNNNAGPDSWGIKYGDATTPTSGWDNWVNTTKEQIAKDGSTYEFNYKYDESDANVADNPNIPSSPTNAIPWAERADHAMAIDKALYLTYQEYQNAKNVGYNCFALVAGEPAYAWGKSFMNFLQEGQDALSFEEIGTKINYVVDAGSSIDDYMGFDAEEGYDFDFVNDVSALKMTVGDQSYDAVSLGDNKYGFVEDSGFADGYRYVLTYVPGEGADEHFTWKTNVAIQNFERVTLTYSVELQPTDEPGTYGQYDREGDGYLNNDDGTNTENPVDANISGLYTNTKATLHAVPTVGEGFDEDFDRPTVSYTVEEPIPEGTIEITPADITIYTGGTGYESAVQGSSDTEVGKTSDGLPEPGFYVDLHEVNDWMIKHAAPADVTTINKGTENEQKVVDLSKYLTFTYNDGQNKRLWKLERYDKTNVSDSMAFSKYIYRILPAQVGDEEIPIRLQFKDQNDKITISDDFTIALDGLYQEYEMSIYAGALNQDQVKAVLTVDGEENVFDAQVTPGQLVVRGVVSDAEDPTTEIADTTPTQQVEDVTAQVPAGTIYKINDSDLAVENQEDVRLLVDSVVPDSNNTLQNAAVSKFDDITAQHECEMNYLDLVDTSNGNAWVTASNDVTVHWPIPADATDDSEFYIVHYEGLDRNDNNALGDEDYTPELYSVEKNNLTVDRETGNITFTVDSFSPFALFYTAEEQSTPGGGGTVIPSDPDDPDPDTPDLNTDDHYSYIVGYPEDYRTGEATDDESLWPVKPQGNITRAEVATIFYRLLTNDARDENWTTSNSFTDVSADSWYNTPVSTLSAMGLIEGYEDGSFRPDNPITRAEFAAIAGRFFTDNDAIYEPGTFSDIEGAEWFADAVQAAKDHDIIGGYPDGSFKPNNPITRAEACSIVNRTTKRVPDADHLLALDEMRNWPDNADTSAWYYADMQEATNGHYYDYVLDENDEIVREEWTSERAPIDWEQVEEELEASH